MFTDQPNTQGSAGDGGAKGQMLPGLAMICLYLILVTTLNV